MSLKQKWKEAKSMNPDTILFVKIGNFYELFGADADVFGKACGLTIGKTRDNLSYTGFASSSFSAIMSTFRKNFKGTRTTFKFIKN